MTLWLKQSTAATVKLGPFVDSADGVTAETSLTISQADIRLSKNGGNIAQTNDATGATHDELGYYDVPLDATDTATLGTLRVAVSESGALPVWQDFMVVPANVWDSFFGADALQVDTIQVGGTVQTANDNGADINAILVDTAEIGAAGAGLTVLATQASVNTIDGNVDSILADTGTDGVVVKAAGLAADAATEIADAVAAQDIETGLTLRDALRLIAAASAGKLSGAATTTIVIKNAVADDKDRITATVDADGNRSAVTVDLT